jgi:hypothetical protein
MVGGRFHNTKSSCFAFYHCNGTGIAAKYKTITGEVMDFKGYIKQMRKVVGSHVKTLICPSPRGFALVSIHDLDPWSS